MAKNKTIETQNSVNDFLATISDEKKRRDFSLIIKLITEQSGFEPKIWGPSIIGFGTYHYKYESGREGDAPLFGASPRANSITLYIGSSFENREELLAKLGKYKLSGGCLHFHKIDDIDLNVLLKMVLNSIKSRKENHAC